MPSAAIHSVLSGTDTSLRTIGFGAPALVMAGYLVLLKGAAATREYVQQGAPLLAMLGLDLVELAMIAIGIDALGFGVGKVPDDPWIFYACIAAVPLLAAAHRWVAGAPLSNDAWQRDPWILYLAVMVTCAAVLVAASYASPMVNLVSGILLASYLAWYRAIERHERTSPVLATGELQRGALTGKNCIALRLDDSTARRCGVRRLVFRFADQQDDDDYTRLCEAVVKISESLYNPLRR